jgi:hypothetical protein
MNIEELINKELKEVSKNHREIFIAFIQDNFNKIQEAYNKDEEECNIWKAGTCCYCKEECNPLSQACGRCLRMGSWYGVASLLNYLEKEK